MATVKGYEVDSKRVFTGNVREFKSKEPIPRNYIVIEPPEEGNVKIFDGHKWFTRDEYPSIPTRVSKKTVEGKDIYNSLSLQEKITIEEVAETNVAVRVAKKELFDGSFRKDSEDLNELTKILIDENVLSKERVDQVIGN